MRTITETIHSKSSGTSNSHYSPSVPLSIYRELAAELQATQGKLDTLGTINHQLTQENQLLRQEIDKAVQLVLQLQQRINTPHQNSSSNSSESYPRQRQEKPSPQKFPKSPTPKIQTYPTTKPKATKPQEYTDPPSFVSPIVDEIAISSEPLILEEQEVSYYSTSEENPSISSWRLFLFVLLIVITAFGAGYVIVRPLFQGNSR
ncbi:MAG: hypothetical protein HRU34_02380 [Richelia sp.]|nr:hypothetical protein [Richelia sp.]